MNGAPDMTAPLQLRDIRLPESPGSWPPAPGGWIAALLLAAALAVLAIKGWRTWRRVRRRRHALAELQALSAQRCGPDFVAAVSAVLKRVALSRFPRTEVAALTGPAWLAFLDRTGGHGAFSEGAGRVLGDGPYAPAPECDTSALLALARDWIRRNL